VRDFSLRAKTLQSSFFQSKEIKKMIKNENIINQITKQIDPQIRYSFFQASNNLNQIAKATNTIAKQEQISTDSQIKILEALFKNEQLLTKIYALLKGKE